MHPVLTFARFLFHPFMTKPHQPVTVYSEKESFAKTYYRDFYIASYQDTAEEAFNRIEPHRHTYYEIIWITEGQGTHVIDFKEYAFKGPCLFLLQPSHIHTIYKDVPTRGHLLKFSESFFAADAAPDNLLLKYDIFDNIHVQPVVHLSAEAVQLLNDLMQKMLVEYEQQNELSKVILVSYLKVFLLQVYKIKDHHPEALSEKPHPHYAVFQQFKRLVEDHFQQQHGVSFYASQLAVAPRTLSSYVHRYAGKTAGDVIRDRLMLEAKRLLYNGALTIKEIAACLGFEEPAYFTRVFTKSEGLSQQPHP